VQKKKTSNNAESGRCGGEEGWGRKGSVVPLEGGGKYNEQGEGGEQEAKAWGKGE